MAGASRKVDGARVLDEYVDMTWRPVDDRVRLSHDVALAMRARGVTMVRVRTGWNHVREVSLRRYLDAALVRGRGEGR
ncbi:hypothetical protein QE374_001220 [Microbacterium sp. SORGH_AS428]|nr:hypothetical protein [Microbacterium sp. SORGH_AS_0428]